jgi:hypothetical protein
MRRGLLWTAAAAALLLGAGCQRERNEGARAGREAEERETAGMEEGTGGAGAADTAMGQVQQASQAEVVIVDPSGTILRLAVDPNTEVVIAGQPASAGDIPAGSDVRASYDTSGGGARATHIEATPPSGTPAPGQQQRPMQQEPMQQQ